MMKLWRELAFMSVAAVVTAGIVVVIKKIIIPVGELAPTENGIFALEVTVLLVLLGAYIFSEIIHGMEMLKGGKRQDKVHIGLSFRDVALVLLSLAGSLAIYLASVKLFKW